MCFGPQYHVGSALDELQASYMCFDPQYHVGSALASSKPGWVGKRPASYRNDITIQNSLTVTSHPVVRHNG